MRRSRPAAREKWRRILAGHAASGKTAAAYCREHQIDAASFYAWKRRLAGVRRRSPEVKFVELKSVCGADARSAGGIEVVVGRRRVLVHSGFDRRLLAEVVGALEEMGEAA